MHIHIGIILLSNIKAQLDMCAAVIGAVLISGHTAYYIAAHLHGLPHQLIGAGILYNSLLRESNGLHIHYALILVFQGQYTLGGLQAGDGIHINVGTNIQYTVLDLTLHHIAAARQNVLIDIVALFIPQHLNGFLQGAALVLGQNIQYIDLIQVDMGIDVGSGGQVALGVNNGLGLGGQSHADINDLAAIDEDIDQLFPVTELRVLNKHLHTLIPSKKFLLK